MEYCILKSNNRINVKRFHYLLPAFLLFFLFLHNLNGQVGGKHVYEFLDLSSSARLTGLGEHQIAVMDSDAAFAVQNPAVLSDSMSGAVSFNHRFYLSDINHGYFSYAHSLPWWGINAHAGIQYIRYGDFTAADIYGNKTGTFDASEVALILGASKSISERISVGINTKWIQSRFETYSSFGFAADLGVHYTSKDKRTGVGMVLKNIGGQFNPYSSLKEDLPFDIRIGVARKLEHLPFRFSIIAHHLHRWNILYDDPNEENTVIFIGQEEEVSKFGVFTDNLFRHLVLNGEFLIGKKESFSVRFAYNHLRRRELSVNNFISMAGFSFGAGIKFGHFKVDYGYSIYHLAGGSSHVGLSMNVDKLMKKF